MPAAELILPQVYDELRKLARVRMARLGPGQTFDPTALVHEVYMRLKKKGTVSWDGRGHFFGAAAIAMRDILVETARRKSAKKRGGDRQRVPLTISLAGTEREVSTAELLALEAALDELHQSHPEHASIVLMRYFVGLSLKEIAELSGDSTRAIEGRWRFSQAWLRKRLGYA